MSGSLVRKISSLAGANYGVNIFEQSQAPTVRGKSTRMIGVVADLPWGPVNTLTDVTSVGQLLATFCPAAFNVANSYVAMRAFLNKPFPGGIKVCRIAATSAATAAKVFVDDDGSGGTPSVDVTAKYPGAIGNLITVAWTANATVATSRDATVAITGTSYSVTYLAVATNAGGCTVTDPGDPYVTFSKHTSADEVPLAIVATALTGGADGTAVAADYVGSISTAVGIRKFYAESANVAVLFVAECPSALITAVNTGITAYATEADKGMAVLCTVASQTVATAITYVASYRDDRLVYAWPKVKTTNFFDSTVPQITVDGNSFIASAIASTDPWVSPGASGGAPFLTGITALENEDATRTDLDNLNAAGVAPFMIEDTLGPIIRKSVTTSITSGLTKIRRRRTADYLEDSLGAFLVQYVETPNDIDLANQALGPNTASEIGAMQAFLDSEVTANHIDSGTVDPYGGNSQLAIDAGTFVIIVMADTFADQDNIILSANIGDGVVTVVS